MGVVSVALLVCIAATAVAAAAIRGVEPRHYTAADQAAARSIVLKRADLGPASVWKGGMTKPDTSPDPDCGNFNPKESDLVITGDAESSYGDAAGLVNYDSEAQILQTAKMVQLDWQRSVEAPGLLPCLRTLFPKSAPASETLVSMARVPVPHISTMTAEYRIVFDLHRTTAPKTVRFLIDLLLVGHGRTEINLATDAPYAVRGPVEESEIRLARLLTARIPKTA
jgi:hypothetical protein